MDEYRWSVHCAPYSALKQAPSGPREPARAARLKIQHIANLFGSLQGHSSRVMAIQISASRRQEEQMVKYSLC